METIKVDVRWCDKNYSCGWAAPDFGSVIVTNKTLEGLKKEFTEALKWQVDSMLADGEDVPEWLASGDFTIEYELHVSALLREAEKLTTMATLSRETGINQKQLSHYASSLKEPRPIQKQRIIDGIRAIGRRFMALC